MRFYGGRNLAKAERDLVLATLKQCSNNRVQTAKVLGMPRSTLDKKLKQYTASGVPVPPAQTAAFERRGEIRNLELGQPLRVHTRRGRVARSIARAPFLPTGAPSLTPFHPGSLGLSI